MNTQDVSVTALNTPSAKAVGSRALSVAQVSGLAAGGGQTVQLFGSIDGTNFVLLSGAPTLSGTTVNIGGTNYVVLSGGASALSNTNIPASGNITADGIYSLAPWPRMAALYAQKTAGDGVTKVNISVGYTDG